MSSQPSMSFQQRSLFQQGYQRFTPAELKQLEWGLRFMPAACSTYGCPRDLGFLLSGGVSHGSAI